VKEIAATLQMAASIVRNGMTVVPRLHEIDAYSVPA
jgi:hypothetical protein